MPVQTAESLDVELVGADRRAFRWRMGADAEGGSVGSGLSWALGDNEGSRRGVGRLVVTLDPLDAASPTSAALRWSWM